MFNLYILLTRKRAKLARSERNRDGSVTNEIEKFGNFERGRVIEAIQMHYGVTLNKVGKRPKWQQDETGRNWWVLGAERAGTESPRS